MTATNHALTGVAIALAVKRPELAIPLAFLSHFLLDMVPHYNPAGATKDTFKNSEQGWATKFKDRHFKTIFTADMVLFVSLLVVAPIITSADVSPWTIFFSALAAAAPDFWGGRVLIYKKLGWNVPSKIDWYTRLHVAAQWMERPWGIWVEAGWSLIMVILIINLLP